MIDPPSAAELNEIIHYHPPVLDNRSNNINTLVSLRRLIWHWNYMYVQPIPLVWIRESLDGRNNFEVKLWNFVLCYPPSTKKYSPHNLTHSAIHILTYRRRLSTINMLEYQTLQTRYVLIEVI